MKQQSGLTPAVDPRHLRVLRPTCGGISAEWIVIWIDNGPECAPGADRSHWFGEAGLRSSCDSPARSPRGARIVLGGRDLSRVASAVDLPDRAVTGERDLLAVRRPRGLDRVDRRARLATEACSVDADRIDLVMAAASVAVEGEAPAIG